MLSADVALPNITNVTISFLSYTLFHQSVPFVTETECCVSLLVGGELL